MPPITFTNEDFHAPDPDQDDPMIIIAKIARYGVGKLLIDQDSLIVGFAGERVDTRGYFDLRTRLGTGWESEEKGVRAIVSTPHLTMKYLTSRGTIYTVRVDQKTTRECYAAGLKMYPKKARRKMNKLEVAMANLDPRTNTDGRLEPMGETLPVIIGKDASQTTTMASDLEEEVEKQLRVILWRNRDLFAWTATDMLGIHPSVMSHKLALFKEARLVAQKKRRMGEEKRKAVEAEVNKLKEARFVREVTYTTWLANVVMVKKANDKWHMCTDYTDLNKACPKDSHPLPSIDAQVDGAFGHKILSFLDAYSGYNQIPMYAPDREKMTFITEKANFCYEVTPFGLKNASATYEISYQLGRVVKGKALRPPTSQNQVDERKYPINLAGR
ncbi:uncharacterized protein LOC106778662 [Vigna radiata var. radiata]|uniref:Uncharacterized protein LOC106778662 n=1 Tax=Vigna radiata var. radiata TaxID=3916 RepID=A0A1S3VUR7_VIGRR|nr:uncharacterized protein LOC106778662 [Vigna radiata var. radiata]